MKRLNFKNFTYLFFAAFAFLLTACGNDDDAMPIEPEYIYLPTSITADFGITEFEYNSNNQLTRQTFGAEFRTFSYNDIGLVTEQKGSAIYDRIDFEYDSSNKLTKLVFPNNNRIYNMSFNEADNSYYRTGQTNSYFALDGDDDLLAYWWSDSILPLEYSYSSNSGLFKDLPKSDGFLHVNPILGEFLTMSDKFPQRIDINRNTAVEFDILSKDDNDYITEFKVKNINDRGVVTSEYTYNIKYIERVK